MMGEDANLDVEIPTGVPEVQHDFRPEVGPPDMDAARPPDRPGIKHWPVVEVMRNRPRLLHAPVYGTNSGNVC